MPEVVEQQLAHVLVNGDDLALLAQGQKIPHQMLIDELVVRLDGDGAAAQLRRPVHLIPLLQQGERLQQCVDVEIVEIGGNGDDPCLAGELLQKVAPVKIQCLQVGIQPLGVVLGHGAGAAEPLELVHIKKERNVRVPGIVSIPPDDKGMSGSAVQLVERRTHPVEHRLERVEGIGAALAVAPQKTHQLVLGDGTAAAINHVCQQQPYFSGAVVAVIDLLIALADRKTAKHPHFEDMIRHLTSPPFPKTFHTKFTQYICTT